ncbi:MAG: hypothetical protein IJR06_03950 [Paludibacteraceae bacterium]|nr:hypothetical protein [Paludibacteraceae bacterium]
MNALLTRKIELLLTVLISVLVLSCTNKKEPNSGVVIDGTVTDICGNKYKVITIGDQSWMAENMRCNTYDTQSEKAGKKIDYVDASDKSQWEFYECLKLSDEQVNKLGYLYHGKRIYDITISTNTNIQSICPNGWHIPSPKDVVNLANYGTGNSTSSEFDSESGKKLKSVNGWFSCDETYKQGTDLYSYNALPSGGINSDGKIRGIGKYGGFISAGDYSLWGHSYPYVYCSLEYCSNELKTIKMYPEGYYSIRCVKD